MATAITTDPMLPQPYSVREVAKETPDTFTLRLEPENAVNRSSFQPGQFSMLWVFGVGELPISISGDPALHDRLVYTVRSVGQATHSLVNRGVGDGVGVRGPFGAGWPVEAARGRDVIVVAGGIGLAPLRPVIYHVLQKPERLWAIGNTLRRAQPAGPDVSQGTRDLGSQPRDSSAGHGRLWRPELAGPCRRSHDVVQVLPAAAGSFGRDGLRS